jgi:hypothetical protein
MLQLSQIESNFWKIFQGQSKADDHNFEHFPFTNPPSLASSTACPNLKGFFDKKTRERVLVEIRSAQI